MQRKFIFSFFFIIVLLFISAHCKKDRPPAAVLPAITQEGKNTIGFKINGEVWVPYFKCAIGSDPCGEISADYGPPNEPPNFLSFQVAREKSGTSSSITITSLLSTTIATTGNKYDSVYISYLTGNVNGIYPSYSKLYGSPGIFMTTKIDSVNKIISGTFEFTLHRDNGGNDSVHVTEGRFDFKMNACICSNH